MPATKLKLTVPDAAKDGPSTYSLSASVIASDRRDVSSNENIIFRLNGPLQLETTVPTDDNGYASHLFGGLASGTYSVQAQVENSLVTSSVVTKLIAPLKVLKPHYILLETILNRRMAGGTQQHKVFVTVLSEDDLPVPNTLVRMIGQRLGKGEREQTTNASGMVIFLVDVTKVQDENQFRILVPSGGVEDYGSVYFVR